MPTNLVASVQKAFAILDLLVFDDLKQQGMTLAALSEKTGIRPNTLYNLLRTMVECGYVRKDAAARYYTGIRCTQIATVNRFQILPEIADTLDGAIHRLRSKTGESVSFVVLASGERVHYTTLQSNNVIKIDYTVLEQDSMYAYPSGKVLVAYCTPEERTLILQKHGYPGALWNGASDAATLAREMDALKARGYADRVSSDGVTSFALPVFCGGKLLGALGVYAPTFRTGETESAAIVAALFAVRSELERALGGGI